MLPAGDLPDTSILIGFKRAEQLVSPPEVDTRPGVRHPLTRAVGSLAGVSIDVPIASATGDRRGLQPVQQIIRQPVGLVAGDVVDHTLNRAIIIAPE